MTKTSEELVRSIPDHGVCQYSWARARAELIANYAKMEAFIRAADEVDTLVKTGDIDKIAAWVNAIREIAAGEEE